MYSVGDSMQNVTNANFGPLIAYLVPGATALWGLSRFSPAMAAWFAATPDNAPTISGFLYLTVASLTVGMTITAVRWAVIDNLHSLTGLRPPALNFANCHWALQNQPLMGASKPAEVWMFSKWSEAGF